MKEKLDFFSKVFLGIFIISQRNFIRFFNPYSSRLQKFYYIFLPILYGLLLSISNPINGQVTITSSMPADICAENPFTISATTTPANRPLIWRSLNSSNANNGVFGDSLSNATSYTPNPVTGTSRIDSIIVMIDEGYSSIWQNLVGIDTTMGEFECTIAGVGNSGARSVNTLATNQNGWVEAVIPNPDVQSTFGLSATNPDNNANTIDYGIELSKGLNQAFVIEDGNFPTSPVAMSSGDIFRVERVGNTIIYKKNRAVIYTSTISNTSALFVDVSMANVGEKLDFNVSFGDPSFVLSADTVIVQVLPAVQLALSGATEICEGGTSTITVTVSGAPLDNNAWSYNLTSGSFNTTSKVYTPNSLVSGQTRVDVISAMTTAASNGICPAVSSSISITVGKANSINLNTIDMDACENDSTALMTVTPGGNADTIFWTSNSGLFTPTNGITNTTSNSIRYKPSGVLSTATRMDTLFLTTDTDFSACPVTKDTIEITVLQADSVYNTFSTDTICEGDSLEMQTILAKGATNLSWRVLNGNGTFLNNTDSNAIYIPFIISNSDLIRSDTLIATTTMTTAGCTPFLDTVVVTVYKVPQLTLSADTTICITDSAFLRTINYVSSLDTIFRWDTLANGVAGELPLKAGDTLNYYYRSDVDIVYPNLFRIDTIIATTDTIIGLPMATGLSCVAAQDTVQVTVIDTANITIPSPPISNICEFDTINVKAQINAGATSVVWSLIPQHNGRGTFVAKDSVETRYIPGNITSITPSRNDTLMAISTGLLGCKPDTVLVEVVVDNAVSYAAIADTPICTGAMVTLTTTSTGIPLVSNPAWTSTGGTFSSPTGLSTIYTPTNLPANTTTGRNDKIFFTAPNINSCSNFKDSLMVMVNPGHFIEIDPSYGMVSSDADTLAVCEGDSLLNIMSTYGSGTTAVTWSSNSGTFNPSNDTTTAFFSNIGQTTNTKYDTLYLKSANSVAGCPVVQDTLIVNVSRAAALSVASDTTVCESGTVSLTAVSTGLGDSIFWEILSSAGLFNTGTNRDSTTSSANSVIYDPSLITDPTITSRVDTILYTSEDPSGLCPAVQDTIFVTVNNGHFIEIDPSYGMVSSNADTLVVCEGDNLLNIMSTYSSSTTAITWSSNSGTFNPSNDTTTTYFSNIGQTSNTKYDTLYLQSTNTVFGCPAATDSLIVEVRKAAALSMTTDTIVCEVGSIKMSAQSTGFGDTVFWEIINSAGQFDNNTSKDTITLVTDAVIFSPTLITDGNTATRRDSIRYTTVDPAGICPLAEDTVYITVYNSPSVEVDDPTKANDTLTICEGIGLQLDGGYSGGAIRATWSVVNNAGTLSNITNDTLAIYIPNVGVSGAFRLDTLVLTPSVVTATCDTTLHTDTLIVLVEKGPVVNPALDSVALCDGNSITIKGTYASAATGFVWSTKATGVGTFIILTDTTATYTPTGAVTGLGRTDTLYLTSQNGTANCLTAVDSMQVFVATNPVLDLGPDQTLCGSLTETLIPQTIGTGNQLTWSSNSGTFVNNPSDTGFYQPDFSIPSQNRMDGIIVSSQDNFGLCPAIADTMLLFVTELAKITIGETGKICEEDTLVLNNDYSGTSATFTYSVSNNGGTVEVANNRIIYIPNENSTQTDRSDQIIINQGDIDGSGTCPTQIDTINISIVNNPKATLVGDTTICEGTQANLLIENFGLIDTFKSRLSNSLINYPSTPATLINGLIKDTILFGTKLVDGFCPAVSQEMVVTIIGPTTINAGNDVEICLGSSVPLNGGLGLGVNVATWSVLNSAGTFDDANKIDAIYTPNNLIGVDFRTDTIILTSSASLFCLMGADTILVTTKSSPEAVLGTDTTISDGQNLALNVNLNNKVSLGIWSANNGSFISSTIDASIYVPDSLGILVTRLDTVVYEGISSELSCADVKDTLAITVVAHDRIQTTPNEVFCRALCLDTLGANLDINTGTVVIAADNIDPLDTCTVRSDLDLKFWYPNLGIPEPLRVLDFATLADTIGFDCDNRGLQNINVYVAQDSTNIQLCPIVLDINDAFIACGERIIAGRITTFNGEPGVGFDVFVENIGIVGGVIPAPVKTDEEGRYSFILKNNQNYKIVPKNNENLSEGVTAFDNVAISRHILALEEFTSPYQTIAADVNKSGTVTAYDIVLIRKVVLAREDSFQNNTSWRFIDADYEFMDVSNAAAEPFKECFTVTQTMGNVSDMDFIAVKIGDPNGTANPPIINGINSSAESRDNLNKITFQTTNLLVKKGEVYEVPFKLLASHKVKSYQFTLDFDDLDLLTIKGGSATPDHFGLTNKAKGLLTACWSAATPKVTNSEWFTLKFKAKSNGVLSEMLQLNSAITPIEAYTTDFENVGIELDFEQPLTSIFELYQNKPNPFKNSTTIGFTLPKSAPAQLTILDMQGKVLRTIKGEYGAGYNDVKIDFNNFPRGIFYYRLETVFGTKIQKLMHLE